MSNQGMQIELSMTAKGVQATLKDAQGAIIQTASLIKTQLPAATVEASRGFSKFKEGISRSRESAMFFTQALGEFGPAGRTAQIALSGVGSMLLGGGVVGVGLAAAQVGVRLLTAAWESSTEHAKKAADAAKKAADKIVEDVASARKRLQQIQFAMDATGEAEQFRQTDYAAAQKALADQEALVLEHRRRMAAARRAGNTDAFAAAQAALEAAKSTLPGLQEAAKIAQQSYDRLLGTEAGKKLEKDEGDAAKAASKAKTPAEQAAERQKATVAYMADIRAKLDADVEAANERGRLMLMEQELDMRRAKRLEAAAAQVKAEWVAAGNVISGAFADIGAVIGGAAQSWMSYFGQLIQKAIQLAIALSATAGPLGWLNAAVAGVALISAVTSVPEFRAMGGPVLAGSPYIVGERGPELMVPSQSGSIVPNHAMGGITINLTAMDTKSVRRFLLDNEPAVAEAVGRAVRNGRNFG